jgi:hypothetical protein
MANPVEALPTLFRGLWKKYTDSEQGGVPLPELRIAPHVQQNSQSGQYQVLSTRLWYDAQLQNAGYGSFDGSPREFQDLTYDTLSTALRPFKSIPVRITDSIRGMLEAENPDLEVLNTGRELVERAIRGRLAAEIITEVEALTDTGTLDLSAAATDVGKTLAEKADDIQETTGARPNIFCAGRKALTRMKTNNTKIQSFVGRASAGGAEVGMVSDQAVSAYFREVADCELVIIDRVAGTAAGAAAFQWDTTAFFGVSGQGEMPSCLKTCSPDADLFEIFVDELRAFEGGPGQVYSAKGLVDVVTADVNLGTYYTLTL